MLQSSGIFWVVARDPKHEDEAHRIALRWGASFSSCVPESASYYLEYNHLGLHLVFPSEPKWNPMKVDFIDAAWAYRKRRLSWRHEQALRAVGFGRRAPERIVDATAGLGQDSYLFALMGARVTAVERSPVIAALLDNGLSRARAAGCDAAQRIELVSADYLESDLPAKPDVVYLDPMYPGRDQQSARQQKSLRMLRRVVGEDLDSDGLFQHAIGCAARRVVVKRPKGAPFLSGEEPQHQVVGRSCRFDIYELAVRDTRS